MDAHNGGLLPEKRRPVIGHAELDSSPVNLRVNLKVLDNLLSESDTWLVRRVLLAFGTLVSEWQRSFAPSPIAVSVERLPNAVRLRVAHPNGALTRAQWRELITPAIEDMVESWGVNLREDGGVWLEFGEARQS